MREFKCFAYLDADNDIETGSIAQDRNRVKELVFRHSPYSYFDEMDRASFDKWFDEKKIIPITIVVGDDDIEINGIYESA